MEKEACRRKIPGHENVRLKKEGRAVYRCERRGSQLIFWCPYCLTEHSHGVAETPAFVPASRSRHCTSDAGMRAHEGGYYVFYEE